MKLRTIRIPCLAFLALAATLSVAQTPTPANVTAPPNPPASSIPANPPSPNLSGIAHIAIRVKDIAASVAFYKKLGFEQAFFMSAKDGSVSQSFVKINDRQFIELYPVSASNPQVGFLHLCFEGADLNAVHDYYVAEGLTPIAVRKAGAGNLLFTLKGPEQYSGPQNIEYTEYMPGSLHSKDFGQHLGADRVATKMTVVTLAMKDAKAARSFYTDKLAFSASTLDPKLFDLPGSSSGEQVEIVPIEPLDSKASITLSAESLDKARAVLGKAGIGYTTAAFRQGQPDVLVVKDPDGNILQIELQAAP